jgi:integrase
MHTANTWLALRNFDWEAHTDRGRREADRAVMRRVIDPDAPIDRRAHDRLQKLRSAAHRGTLARVLRQNLELGMRRNPLAPPVARLLARNPGDATLIATGLEDGDPDPRAVIETERLLEAPVPSPERLAWIVRLLAPSRARACEG